MEYSQFFKELYTQGKTYNQTLSVSYYYRIIKRSHLRKLTQVLCNFLVEPMENSINFRICHNKFVFSTDTLPPLQNQMPRRNPFLDKLKAI